MNSTSGTTGLPKCVVHTQNRWFYFHRLAVAAGKLTAEDVFLNPCGAASAGRNVPAMSVARTRASACGRYRSRGCARVRGRAFGELSLTGLDGVRDRPMLLEAACRKSLPGASSACVTRYVHAALCLAHSCSSVLATRISVSLPQPWMSSLWNCRAHFSISSVSSMLSTDLEIACRSTGDDFLRRSGRRRIGRRRPS